jgi:hypothetical protein
MVIKQNGIFVFSQKLKAEPNSAMDFAESFFLQLRVQ